MTKGFRPQVIPGGKQQPSLEQFRLKQLEDKYEIMHKTIQMVSENLDIRINAITGILKAKEILTEEILDKAIMDAHSEMQVQKEYFADQKDGVQNVDEPADSESVVITDFVGKLDGIPFQGGSAKAYRIDLKKNEVLKDLQESFVGKKAGDEFDVTVRFPYDYEVKQLQGKETIFHVNLLKVKKRIAPKVDQTPQPIKEGA